MAVREPVKVGQQHQTLRDAVVDELRTLIIEGTLDPGQRLIERELATQLDVSRIPLREAILQLESEGLVQRLPRRGSVVAVLTREDVGELFDIREALEALAAGLAAVRRDPDALARLRRNLDQVAAATTRRQAGMVARLNVLFHQDIVQASGNKTLVAMMAPLHSRMHWLFRMAAASTSDLAALGGNHAEIYEAIAGGHRATAERLTRRHVIEMREPTLAFLP